MSDSANCAPPHLSGTLLVRGKLGIFRPHRCWVADEELHWRQPSKPPSAKHRSTKLRNILAVEPAGRNFIVRVRARGGA